MNFKKRLIIIKLIMINIIMPDDFWQYHCFMAHPESGMKASKIEFKFCSSAGSNFPYFLIFCNRVEWLPLKWAKNLASNLEISEVTILSRYPLTPAKMTQTCSSATIGTWINIILRIVFVSRVQSIEHLCSIIVG